MHLSELVNKNVYVNTNLKGKCVGVGISLKSYAVKYLLCSTATQSNAFNHVDFCVSISAIQEIQEDIHLSHLRPVIPKQGAKLFIGPPVYNEIGGFIGNVRDVYIQDFCAVSLLTSTEICIPMQQIAAFSDAVILKKDRPYPIGQRIPAYAISQFLDKKEPFIHKQNLKTAIGKSNLVKLTLSLAPFHFNTQNKA